MNTIPNLLQRYKIYRRGKRIDAIQEQFEKFWATFPLCIRKSGATFEEMSMDVMMAFYSGAQFDVNDVCYADFFKFQIEKALRLDPREVVALRSGFAKKEQFDGIRLGLLSWIEMYNRVLRGVSPEFDNIMDDFAASVRNARKA